MLPSHLDEFMWREVHAKTPPAHSTILLSTCRSDTRHHSDTWAAYRGLREHNYIHKVINHSEHFVNPEDPTVHTQNIERHWRDIKKWSERSGVWSKFLYRYLARYLLVTSEDSYANLLHPFLKLGAQVYPPQSEPKQAVDLDRRSGTGPR